ncbi:MAG: hypothetical protein CMN73_03980 [Sphingomonas sp.]|nr:hypothetical protein [Sphingomonas sp.]
MPRCVHPAKPGPMKRFAVRLVRAVWPRAVPPVQNLIDAESKARQAGLVALPPHFVAHLRRLIEAAR